MELADIENCILCHEPIIAYVNIKGHPKISTMKVNIAQHKQCKKHYDAYVRLKFRQKVIENLLEDKQAEIMHFLNEKTLQISSAAER
jgi:hypothetical protein